MSMPASSISLRRQPAKVVQAIDNLRIALDGRKQRRQLLIVVVLFERDDRTLGFLHHGTAFPSIAYGRLFLSITSTAVTRRITAA